MVSYCVTSCISFVGNDILSAWKFQYSTQILQLLNTAYCGKREYSGNLLTPKLHSRCRFAGAGCANVCYERVSRIFHAERANRCGSKRQRSGYSRVHTRFKRRLCWVIAYNDKIWSFVMHSRIDYKVALQHIIAVAGLSPSPNPPQDRQQTVVGPAVD